MSTNDLPDIDSSGDDDGPTHEYEVCDRLECGAPLTHLVVQRQDCLLGDGQFSPHRRHFEVCKEHADGLDDTLDGVVLVEELSQAPFRRLIADGGEREDPDPHWNLPLTTTTDDGGIACAVCETAYQAPAAARDCCLGIAELPDDVDILVAHGPEPDQQRLRIAERGNSEAWIESQTSREVSE